MAFAVFRHLARYGVICALWIDKHSGKLCGRPARRVAKRAKSPSVSERKRIATKASKAAAKVRTAKAKAKKQKSRA